MHFTLCVVAMVKLKHAKITVIAYKLSVRSQCAENFVREESEELCCYFSPVGGFICPG